MCRLPHELNFLHISRGKDIKSIDDSAAHLAQEKSANGLKELQSSLSDTKSTGDFVKLAKTLDQAQALLTVIGSIAEKTLSSTVTLTVARGRGKSAASGLAIAAALAQGYLNILVTSRSPENLQTLFDFVFKGLDSLGYEEHLDAIIRIKRVAESQIVQYIQPEDAHVLGQTELFIIDDSVSTNTTNVRPWNEPQSREITFDYVESLKDPAVLVAF